MVHSKRRSISLPKMFRDDDISYSCDEELLTPAPFDLPLQISDEKKIDLRPESAECHQDSTNDSNDISDYDNR